MYITQIDQRFGVVTALTLHILHSSGRDDRPMIGHSPHSSDGSHAFRRCSRFISRFKLS